MKYLLSLVLISFVLTVAASDHYATPIYQANPLCPLRITLTAGHDPIEYHLRFDQTVVSQGVLGDGESVEMDVSLTDQWYVLLIEWNGDGDYAVSSALACETDEGTGGHTADVVQAVEPLYASLRSVMEDYHR